MEITQIQGLGIESVFGAQDRKDVATEGVGAGKFLGELVAHVDELQKQSDLAIQKLATGEEQGLHETMIAMEKANIEFQEVVQIRNKFIEGYQEIMRMSV